MKNYKLLILIIILAILGFAFYWFSYSAKRAEFEKCLKIIGDPSFEDKTLKENCFTKYTKELTK